MSDKLILIVEDSQTDRHIAVNVCTGSGYKVMTVDNGVKALQAAADEKPDLILLDVILPEQQNGFQICRQLKKAPETADIKIIMVTSKSQPSDKFWGMKQGADDYISKPYDEEELLSAIRKQLA